MVLLTQKEDCRCQVSDHAPLTFGPDLFERARDLFHEQEGLRCQAIRVVSAEGEELPFCVTYMRNLTDKLPPQTMEKLRLYCSDFWEYELTNRFIDFTLLNRAQVYIFDVLEEYTYLIAKMIRRYFPDRYIFFKDPRAAMFFEKSDLFNIITGDAQFFNRYHYLISKSIMQVTTRPHTLTNYDQLQFLEKRYTSLELMTSLFWSTEFKSYGDKNPDKIFVLIKSPVSQEGLADVTRFPLYRAEIASRLGSNVIPVIDLSVPGDNNQFNHGDGTNIWTMFYKQITTVPLEEVYQSKNVIQLQDQIVAVNPYVEEMILFADYAYLFRKWLRFSDTSKEFLDRQFDETIPDKNARILGVIGRGTDYRHSTVKNFLNQPATPDALLEHVRNRFKEGGFDYIFLATEDEAVYRTFMESDIASKVLSVDQPRIDYNPDENNGLLIDIYQKEERDGYKDNLRYLGIINILSKCTSLIASTDCGAYFIATGLNDHKYEFVELLYDKGKETAGV